MKNLSERAYRLYLIGTLLSVIGHLTLTVGVWMLRPAAGVICLGLGPLTLGLLLCRSAGGMRDDR